MSDEKSSIKSRASSPRGYLSSGSDDELSTSSLHDKHFVAAPQQAALFNTFFIVTTVMMIWPWIFFGILWALGGVEMPRTAAEVAHKHPQDVTFFVTSISNVLSMAVGLLFSRAVVVLAKKWVAHKHTTTAFIAFFTSLKSRHPPPLTLRSQGTMHLFVIALFYNTVFTYASPGLAALLTPFVYTRTFTLTGTELDFASTDASCLAWFGDNIIPHYCDWSVDAIPGLNLTNCLEENQLVDVLESGRGSILTYLSDNTISLTYTQLGGITGLRFLGSMRGVLAIGPNGVPALDTLSSTSFSNEVTTPDLFYNYTLDLQGVFNNVSCFYDTSSPIRWATMSDAPFSLWDFNGTCDPGRDVLINATYIVPPSNNSLGFWACKASDVGDSFNLYIRGGKTYAPGIGNITCNLSPFQPSVFSLQYMGQPGIFNFTTQEPTSTSSRTYTELLTRSIMALGSNFAEAQTMSANSVAESIITFGVKSLGLQPYVKDPEYLRLYEAMIRGILDYEATYIRLLYSAKRSAPSSCLRDVNGYADVDVFGWFASRNTAAYLVPITLINLTTLIILVIAKRIADADGSRRLPNFDPTNPAVIIKSNEEQKDDPVLVLGHNQEKKFGLWPKNKIVASNQSVNSLISRI